MPDDRYTLYFLDLPEGRAVFPLFGFGRGWLADAEAERAVKRRIGWTPFIIWICTMVAMTLQSFFQTHRTGIILLGFLASLVTPYLLLRLFMRRLAPCDTRLSFRDSVERAAQKLSYGALYAQVVLGTTFTIAGAAALATRFGEPALSIIALLVGFYLLWFWALVVRTQSRRRHAEISPRLR